MTGYALAHLAVAAFCALFAVAHLALWRSNRGDRAQLALAICLLGFAQLSLGMAGCSTGSHVLGPTRPWLMVAATSGLFVFPALLVLPQLLGGTLTRTRRLLAVLGVVAALVRGADVAWLIVIDSVQYWEQTVTPLTSATGLYHWTVAFIFPAVWWVDAARLYKRDRGLLVLVASGSSLAGALMLRELVPIARGQPLPPSLFDLTGLTLVAFASGHVFLKLSRLLRHRAEDDALSSYTILRSIGAGGMGELYLARKKGPEGFEHEVALKRMRGDGSAASVTRFLLEARLAGRLNHPNVVTVFDLGRAGDGWFIAMEYLAGASLLQVLKYARSSGKSIPWQVVVAIGEHVCRGVAYAHEAGVFHRDIKPGNVMVTFEGSVKVVDFGIAVAADSPPKPGLLTRPGAVIGTPDYLAPERREGALASAATDQYAIGLVLGELLLARPHIEGLNLRALRPDAPEGLIAAVERALHPSAAKRWPDAQALGDALHELVAAAGAVDLAKWLRDYLPDEWNSARATVREPQNAEQRATRPDRPQ